MNRDFKNDFLASQPELKPFYAFPSDLNGLNAAIQNRKQGVVPPAVLVDELRDQYEGISLSVKTNSNLALLEQPETFTVTTGHQLCLCGGPLYVTYKILTVIRLAEELKKHHPDKNFVPVFWMATEDHDDAEAKPIQYTGKFSGAVGRHVIENSIKKLLSESGREHFSTYYSPGKTWSQSARELLNDWFGEYGLVIIDGDSPQLKQYFSKIAEADLFKNASWNATRNSDAQLENLGYSLQLHLREINLFYLTANSRERLEKVEDGFITVDSKLRFSENEIRKELEDHPEKFSPNAALRPLYQEMILPNICYSGGWGEFAYWFQLKPIFDYYKVNFPVLIPRFSATILTEFFKKELEELELITTDFEQSQNELFAKIYNRFRDQGKFDQEKIAIENLFQQLSKLASATDPTLERNVLAEQNRVNEYLDNLDKKLNKSIRNKQSKLFSRLEGLLNWVNPGGEFQERVLDLTSVSPGKEKELIQKIYGSIHPLTFSKKWI